GHVHAYEHSLVNGVHYLTVGGGGAALSTSWRTQQPWTVYREATYHFTLLDVCGDTVYCRGVKPTGAVFDSFALVPAQTRLAELRTAEAWSGLRVRSGPGPGRFEFRFTTAAAGPVRLTVYDATGRARAALVRACLPAGEHRCDWDAGALPGGRYFAVLQAFGRTAAVPITIRG
ncbi:MAG: hypothetical protein ABIK62_08255, partial [candidate division WOR-3 bacterium]